MVGKSPCNLYMISPIITTHAIHVNASLMLQNIFICFNWILHIFRIRGLMKIFLKTWHFLVKNIMIKMCTIVVMVLYYVNIIMIFYDYNIRKNTPKLHFFGSSFIAYYIILLWSTVVHYYNAVVVLLIFIAISNNYIKLPMVERRYIINSLIFLVVLYIDCIVHILTN